MAQFQFQWSDGTLTAIDLPNDEENCDSTTPSSRMNNAHLEIVASAGYTGAGLHEIENYCIEAHAQLLAIKGKASGIKNYWDELEIDCANWNNMFRWCSNHDEYCKMSENDLESAYYSWADEPGEILASISNLESVWQETSEQIELDGQQATASALLDQLIAETNQMISLTAYQNEVRELDVKSKKTQEIFAPLMIVLILLGVGFYLYK